MPKTRPAYPAEFRRQMVDLVRAGRDPTDLAREPPADPGLTATERDELARLRREVRQLKLERDILSRATAWFARETGVLPSGSSGS